MEIITGHTDEKIPVNKETWPDPQRKLGPVEPLQGGFKREVQSQMVGDRSLSLRRSVPARGVWGPQRFQPSCTSILAQNLHRW